MTAPTRSIKILAISSLDREGKTRDGSRAPMVSEVGEFDVWISGSQLPAVSICCESKDLKRIFKKVAKAIEAQTIVGFEHISPGCSVSVSVLQGAANLQGCELRPWGGS